MLRDGSEKKSDTYQGTDKVERYHWAEPGDTGKLMWLDKNNIEVDHKYQREADNDKANRLAADFSWSKFGTLIVGERESGKYFCAEGQHRLLAAQKRSDVQKVPCFVFKSRGSKDEAIVFVGTNVNRKPVPAFAKYKALLVCGDAVAVAVKKLAEQHDRRVESYSQKGTVSCVALLMTLTKRSPDELARVFPIASAMCNEEGIPDRLLDALVYIETKLPGGQSLCDQPWRKKLEKMPLAVAMKSMASAAAFHAKGGAKVWASGLMVQLNKHQRRKLLLEGQAADAP